MSILKIQDMPLIPVTDDLKIPTGGFGDVAINISSLRSFLSNTQTIFQTSSAHIFIRNGNYQQLNLTFEVILKTDIPVGDFVYIVIPPSIFNVDFSRFDNANQFNYDRTKESHIFIFNFDGKKTLFGTSVITGG